MHFTFVIKLFTTHILVSFHDFKAWFQIFGILFTIFVRFPFSMDLIIHYNVHWEKINEETKELNITKVS
jgi:hypothetical protein